MAAGFAVADCGLFLASGLRASLTFSFRFGRLVFAIDEFLRRAAGHHGAALGAGLGADVDDPVGGFDDVEVVFDDDDRVPVVDEAVEHDQQLPDVLEVEARRRLVEHVERVAGVGPSKLGS